MLTIPQLIIENETRWQKCQISPTRIKEVNEVAARLVAPTAKIAYQQIEQDTGVPWFIIAVIHEREASQNWNANLAQGDPWNRPSRHVPKGRGPFKSFREAANDALKNCAPKAAEWKDWSAGGSLTILEEYNGLGYEEYHAEASPYNWGATTEEEWGKYVNDGHWAHVWDTQIGCAAMLKAMIQLDSSIQFSSITSSQATH